MMITKPTQRIHVEKLAQDPSIRLETGAVAVNMDWPGVFIRGDDCFSLQNQTFDLLLAILNREDLKVPCLYLTELIRLFSESLLLGPEYKKYIQMQLEAIEERLTDPNDQRGLSKDELAIMRLKVGMKSKDAK